MKTSKRNYYSTEDGRLRLKARKSMKNIITKVKTLVRAAISQIEAKIDDSHQKKQ